MRHIYSTWGPPVELARRLGEVRDGFQSGFIVAMAHCEYKKPIREERSITVSAWVSRIGDRSWDLDYTVLGPKRMEYVIGRTTQVCFDYNAIRTVRIPDGLRRGLRKYAKRPLAFRKFG